MPENPARQPAANDLATRSTAPALATAGEFQEAITEQAMAFVKHLRNSLDLSLEASYAAASEASLLYPVATMQKVQELDPTLDWYVDEACGGCTGALMAGFDVELGYEIDIDEMDARIEELSGRLTKRLGEYANYNVRMPIDPQSGLARQFALRVRAEVGGTPASEDAVLAAIGSLTDINPRGHLKTLFNR